VLAHFVVTAQQGGLVAGLEILRAVPSEPALITRFGVFGLADLGRVFLEGESSDLWRTAVGGGVSLSVGNPKNVLSVALASSEGRLCFYLQGGFSF